VRFTVSNPATPTQVPAVTTAESRPWVQDVVSAFYFARTRKLGKENREVSFYILDEAKQYHIGVAPVGREELETDVGTFKTIKVDARIFNGRFVRKEGQLFVWLTDDARRIPVKAWLKLPAGTVTFQLKTLEEGTTPTLASGIGDRRPEAAQRVALAPAAQDDEE
jgi:hypothetical protein